MGINKFFEERFTKNLIFQSLSLDIALKSLLSISYSSKGSRILANFLIKLNSKIYERLTLGPSQEKLELISKRLGTLLSILHIYLEYVVNSQIQYSPAPFSSSLENLVERYIPGGYIIVKSAWYFNYSFIEISRYIKSILEFSDISIDNELPEYLVALSFPRVEKENVLLHCAFAHEIGHFFNMVQKISNHIPIHIKNPEILAGISPSYYSRVLKSIQFWYGELVSDVLGIHLFGPAYFCSFAEIGLSFSLLNEASLEHPPALMRLKLMISVLKELGFLDFFQDMAQVTDSADNINYYKFFENWNELLDANQKNLTNPLDYLTNESVSLVHEDIKDKVKQFIKNNGYSTDKFKSEVPPLIKRILKLIPPNEIIFQSGKNIKLPNFISIVNAGWIVYSVKMQSLYNLLGTKTWEEKFQAKTMLNNLILKSIEYDTIKRMWENKQ